MPLLRTFYVGSAFAVLAGAVEACAQQPHRWPVAIDFDDPAAFHALTVPGGLRFPDQTRWHLLDSVGGRAGTAAMRVVFRPGDAYEPLGPEWPAVPRVFVRYWFRTEGDFARADPARHNVKGPRFKFNGGNLGVLKQERLNWGFDAEADAVQVATGMSYGRPDPADAPFIVQGCSDLGDGRWHSIEIDYDRAAGEHVEVRFWCDGKAMVLRAGSSSWGGSAWPGIQYVGGDAAANVPTTLRARRRGEALSTGLALFDTISQGFDGSIWLDDLVIDLSRIGP